VVRVLETGTRWTNRRRPIIAASRGGGNRSNRISRSSRNENIGQRHKTAWSRTSLNSIRCNSYQFLRSIAWPMHAIVLIVMSLTMMIRLTCVSVATRQPSNAPTSRAQCTWNTDTKLQDLTAVCDTGRTTEPRPVAGITDFVYHRHHSVDLDLHKT